METYIKIPHRRAHGLCPVNGIRDLVQWRTGRNWSNEFVWGLGQGGGFAYLRFNSAKPPRQLYTGIATPRQHRYLADLLQAEFMEVEKRSFKFSWQKAREALDTGNPPILGPLDMYFLHFYQDLYHQRHIPIHFLLMVGSDEEKVYVLDTDMENVQTIPLEELQLAWDVNVPGLGKQNRLAVLDIPRDLPADRDLICQAVHDQCQSMLHPPVAMIGIPAMRKIAGEIGHWKEELGEEVARQCLRQTREYLNSPPDLEGNHLTAGRDIYVTYLEEAAQMADLNFSPAIALLNSAIAIIPELSNAIQNNELDQTAAYFHRWADIEEQTYTYLQQAIS